MKELSILSNPNKIHLFKKPFPHLIIDNALPAHIAKELTDSFPLHLFDLSKNNQRIDISASEVIKNADIPKLWKQFIEYHSSHKFFIEVINAFESCLQEDAFNKYINCSSGVRGIDHHSKSKEILLDAQISVNTPVQHSTSVRNAHVDNSNKLFSGLFYLRKADDQSVGGDLDICGWQDGYSENKKIKFYKEGIDKKHINHFKRISYGNNIAVIFLNSLDSVHLVTERQITRHSRCFVNLVGEMEGDLFTKPSSRKDKIFQIKSKAKQWLIKLRQ